ncbi:MAG: hypothetical protein ABJZ79_14970 [Parasphingorhabdus sp.]|uniref:hypothetical protein n=1 Tax=Parasphingorhabdus sp. TaxID=2709688 RepID=UPI0032977B05
MAGRAQSGHPIILVVIGPDRTFEQRAANGGSEPEADGYTLGIGRRKLHRSKIVRTTEIWTRIAFRHKVRTSAKHLRSEAGRAPQM